MRVAAIDPCLRGLLWSEESENSRNADFLGAFTAHNEGDFESAQFHLHRRLQQLESVERSRGEVWEVCLLRVVNLLAWGRPREAEAAANEMLELAEVSGNARARGLALSSLCAINASLGHPAYAIELGKESTEVLRNHGSVSDLSRVLINLGYAQVIAGDLRIGTDTLIGAASVAEAVGAPLLRARALHQLGYAHQKAGQFNDARRRYEAALGLFTEIGAHRYKAQVAFSLASMGCLIGQDGIVAALLAKVLDRSDTTITGLRRLRWELLAAWLRGVRGESDASLKSLSELAAAFESVDSLRDKALCHEFSGDVHWGAGRFEEAETSFSAGASVGRMIADASDVVLECLWKLGEVHLATGQLHEALASARRALRIACVSGNRFERAAVYRLRGKIQIARGRTQLAERLLQHAWHEYSSMGAEADARKTWDVLTALRRGEATGEVPPAVASRPPRITIGPSRSAVRALEAEIRAAGIISEDARVLDAYQQAVRVADTRLPVLVLGETGTGKELFASLIHKRSSRSRSFVPVNCAALPPDLLDAELFGHSRGAFTGAFRDRPGLIEEANEGTLFLDEVGEMTLPVQGRLLRALEQGEIRRIGETKPRFVTTRYVAATHRNLEDMVRQGSFRTDLFFRLKGVVLQIPPLRERKRDIELLTDHFLKDCGTRLHRSVRLSSEARAQMLDHPWPGNVRELKSLIDRLVSMSDDGAEIDSPLLGLGSVRTGASLAEHLEEEERSRVLGVLQSVRWNQSAAARALRIKRTTLIGKMKRLGIEPPSRK